MKRNSSKLYQDKPTLADLIQTVARITHDERLSALIVADMINSRRVRIEGAFEGRRVVVA
jgi:hypothetical protein